MTAVFPVANDPTITLTFLSQIDDLQNPIPHSYIFLPPRNEWPKLFHNQMIELMEKEGHNIPEECDYDTNSKDNNYIDDDDNNEEEYD